MSHTTTIIVSDMTCGHCVSAVKEEISAIDNVTGVDVDLASGSVSITSTAPIADESIREAVTEAGYTVR
ncbi:heavy-metal-associated domain-containing protein [Hoyosella rhizosphaerae]|uniref:HMA domain-containing protein n=1 Tax=Hoyosella rhizosphaerae TaxID=1755582 RepID=A0A916XA96_9ACTN|nr:heavy-metal-associated domain-containing protein [Hoyosella rhizosphaerae]MBN4926713.1 heavy-metal-associated domain-containing protein [Hoyosella rhizosphaerae]GGC57004.1 hypothetical protein GCM10011410_06930 [Hoyosella rhizosphaerae]